MTSKKTYRFATDNFDLIPCQIETKYQASTKKEGELGGDFLDIFEIGDDLLCVVIGDVMGKGTKASKIAYTVMANIKNYLVETQNPMESLQKLNDLFCSDPQFCGFITIFCGIYNCKTNNFIYCTGGHEPPLVYHAETGAITELHPTGHLIGAMPDAIMENKNIRLGLDDKLFMFTDGLTEARDKKSNETLNIDGLTDIFVDAVKNGEGLSDIFNSVQNRTVITDDVAAILMNVG